MPRAQKIHDEDLLTKAVKAIDKGMSAYKASRLFGIPETTLRDHARGTYRGYITTFGRQKCLNEEEETCLVAYLEYMAGRGFPLTKSMVKRLALEIVKRSGRKTLINMKKGPSNKWLKKFFVRHPRLSVRKAHPLDKARAAVDQGQIDQYFDLLEETLERLDLKTEPSRIFNCDETGFGGSLKSSGRNVVTRKGARQAYQVQMTFSGHVTLHLAISASGQTLPPELIFSKNLPRASYADGLPESWSFQTTESGFINSDLFYNWFTEIFLQSCGKRRPCLLIMDNHTSHLTTRLIDAAQENGIDLLYFPSHTSHLLQPLDVGYFHVLKSKVVDLAAGLGYSGARCLPRHLFPKVVHQAMNTISPSTVAAAFSSAGIYPLNKSAVKALSGPVSVSEMPCQGSSTDDIQNETSESQAGKTNMLVKIGMVPESLANVFIEPPVVSSGKKRKDTLRTARVYKSDHVIVQTVKDATQSIPVSSTESLPIDVNEEMSEAICTVCLTGKSDLFWVGCDRCDAWLHYECLPASEQTDVDMSLICKTSWFCLACREE